MSKISIYYKLKSGMSRVLFMICFISVFIVPINQISAETFNKQINYQGKLTNSSGVAVSTADYNLEFKIYTALGVLVWTETRSGGNKVTVTSGLFSVMLGEVTPISSIDWDQPLYLGINVGGTGVVPIWDGEMTPRKVLGSVPSAFESDKLDNLDSTQFLRSDATSTLAVSSSDTAFIINQTGAGKLVDFQVSGSSIFSVNNAGLASTTDLRVSRNATVDGLLSVTGSGTSSIFDKLSIGGGLTVTGVSTFFNELTAPIFTATSTSLASTFPYASSTALTVSGTGYFPGSGIWNSSGNVGIGTTSPNQQLEITKNFGLASTTYNGGNPYGIIYKNDSPFIHNFNYGNNGTVTTLGYNTFIGENAGNLTMGSSATVSTQSSYNTAVGYYSLFSNTTGRNNTALGSEALRYNTTGSYNTAQGDGSLLSNTTGSYNTAIGLSALYTNTTGDYNTANGANALAYNTTGSNNTALGLQALYRNTTGNYNTAIGRDALRYNTLASSTIAVGYYAGRGTADYSNKGGVYLGYQSGYSAQTGSDYNTLLGYNSGYNITTGARNLMMGYEVGTTTTLGSDNILIGSVLARSATDSNFLNIGNAIYGDLLTGNVGIGTTTPYSKLSVWGSGTGSNILANFVNSASTSVLSILENGKVGIGTTTPYLTLGVMGSAMFADNVRASTFTATSTSLASTFPYASSTALTVSGTGYFGTASTSNLIVSNSLTLPTGYTLSVANGGTNLSSYAIGDLIYASGATTLSRMADVATGNVLLSGGVGSAPSWGKLNLATAVSGVLSMENGGTGMTSFSFSQGWLSSDGINIISSTSPTVNYVTATSTTKASTFPYASSTALTVSGTGYFGTASTSNLIVSLGADVGTLTSIGLISGTDINISGGLTTPSITLGGVTMTSWPAGGVGGGSFWATTTNSLIGYPSLTGSYAIVIGAGATSSDNIKFEVLGNTKLGGSLITTGNVGIGTTSPYAPLSVNGQAVALYFTATSTSLASTFPYASSTALTVSGTGYFGTASTSNLIVSNSLTLPTGYTLSVANGGTNLSSYAIGDLIYASGATTLSRMADVATGNVLLSGGVGSAPSWGKLNLATAVSGVLSMENGGTGMTSFSFSQGWLSSDGINIISSTSPTVNYVTATSTTKASTFPYASSTALTVSGTGYFGTASTSNLIVSLGADVGTLTSIGLISGTDINISGGLTTPSITLGGVTMTSWPAGGVGGGSFWATTTNSLIGYPSLTGSYAIVIGAGATSSDNIKFEVLGNTKLGGSLITTGNVGIGTTSPYAPLSVNGQAVALYFTATSTSLASTFPYASSTALTVSGAAYLPGLGIWNSSGNVGIGTVSPSVALHISSSQDVPFRIETTGNGAVGFDLWRSGVRKGTFGIVKNAGQFVDGSVANDLVFRPDGGGNFIFANSAATIQNMVILNTGNVGIGTTTPYSKLSVWGSGTGSNILANFVNSASTSVLSIFENGNVGIGKTAPSTALDVVGTASSTGLQVNGSGSITEFLGVGTTSQTDYGIKIATGSTYPIYDDSGAHLTPVGTWTNAPSWSWYKNIQDVPNGYLDKIRETPVYEWKYRDETIDGMNRYASDQTTHLSPFLDDYNRIFGLGISNGINLQDWVGVTFVGLKELDLNIQTTFSKLSYLIPTGKMSTSTDYSLLSDSIKNGDINMGDVWILDRVNGQIKSLTSLDMSNFDITNVRTIKSSTDKWSLSEEGVLTVKEIKAEKLCLGQTCVTESELKMLLQTANLSSLSSPSSVSSSGSGSTPSVIDSGEADSTTTPSVESTPLEELPVIGPVLDLTPSEESPIVDPVLESTPLSTEPVSEPIIIDSTPSVDPVVPPVEQPVSDLTPSIGE